MSTHNKEAALIDAAEAHAVLYDGDGRSDIKTDVLNAFYAGAKFAQQAHHLREFVEAVAKNYTDRDEMEGLICLGCEVELGNGKQHKPDCIVLRARTLLSAAPAAPQTKEPK